MLETGETGERPGKLVYNRLGKICTVYITSIIWYTDKISHAVQVYKRCLKNDLKTSYCPLNLFKMSFSLFMLFVFKKLARNREQCISFLFSLSRHQILLSNASACHTKIQESKMAQVALVWFWWIWNSAILTIVQRETLERKT